MPAAASTPCIVRVAWASCQADARRPNRRQDPTTPNVVTGASFQSWSASYGCRLSAMTNSPRTGASRKLVQRSPAHALERPLGPAKPPWPTRRRSPRRPGRQREPCLTSHPVRTVQLRDRQEWRPLIELFLETVSKIQPLRVERPILEVPVRETNQGRAEGTGFPLLARRHKSSYDRRCLFVSRSRGRILRTAAFRRNPS